jgi:hypothetical protein
VQKFRQILTHKTFQLFSILVVLISILALTTIFRPDVFQEMFSRIGIFAADLKSGKMWKEKSQAKLFVEEGSLKINFQITPEDEKSLKFFNQKLGVSDSYLQGIALKIDEATQKKLQSFLPVHLDLQIGEDKIMFDSGILTGFASSLVTETTEFATGSSKLKMSQYSPTQMEVDINQPEPLLQYATSSGQFVLSDKLQPLYPILGRVSAIKMSVNGKSVSGKVKIK